MTNKSDIEFNIEHLLTLEVSTTRHYSAQSVTVTMGGSFVVKQASDTDRYYSMLFKRVQDQHDQYAKKFLTDETLSVSKNDSIGAGKDTSWVMLPVERISPQGDTAQAGAKIHGGKWKKYGVMCYPEVWMKYADALSDYVDKDLALGTVAAKIETVDGKPKRVLQIGIVSDKE